MRDIKDMSPETKARHLKHMEDTKTRSALMKSYQEGDSAISEKQKALHKREIESLREKSPNVVNEWESAQGMRAQHIGMQEGNVGDHNTGRTNSVVYEHKRNK